MTKPRILFLLLAVSLVLGAMVFSIAKPNEPSYKGHSLSYWLDAASGSRDADVAVRAIGTNAFPVLLRWISHEPPAWKVHLAFFAYNHIHDRRLLVRPEYQKALAGFAMLGTNATPVIPALVSLMNDTAHPEPANYAMDALALLGPQAFPYLTNELSSTNPRRRIEAIASITDMTFHGVQTNACLTALLSATTDADPRVRSWATNCILTLTPEALTNTPPQ